MTANERILLQYQAHCTEPEFTKLFSWLLAECASLGYEIYFGPDHQSGFLKSSHDKTRRRVFLHTETETGNRLPSAILISFAHEYGHIQDPIQAEDMSLTKGTRNYHVRQKERELVAWDWAEDWFRRNKIWPRIHREFSEQKAHAIAEYQKDWKQHGIWA